MSDYPKHLNRYATSADVARSSADVARQTDSRYDPAASNHPPLRVGQLIPVVDKIGNPVLVRDEDHEAAVRAQYSDIVD